VSTKVIPITQAIAPLDEKALSVLTIPSQLIQPNGHLLDQRGRELRDLRISVTDRCNFRCPYCMPKEIFDKDFPYLDHNELLSFEEITRIASIFITHGVEKIRLTGGEPLLRKNIEILVQMLAQLKTLEGKPLDLTLTTNGSLLKRKAAALREAGLKRLTVSLDAIHDDIFKKMNDVDFPVDDVLEGIEVAKKLDFESIKVNMVVKRGVNDHEILALAEHFRGTGIIARFIEYMDVGNTNGWKMDEVLPSKEVIAMIHKVHPLTSLDPQYTGEVAERWKYQDGQGEIGVISSVTQAFCKDCTRARLSMEGKLFLCLFGTTGYDLKSFIRGEYSDLEIANVIRQIWTGRDDHYSEIRGQAQLAKESATKVEMSYIGG